MTTSQTQSSRRHFLALAGAAALSLRMTGARGESEPPLRIGLPQTLVAPSVDAWDCLQLYFHETAKQPVVIVARKSFQELASLVVAGEVDAAWITGYAMVQRRDQLEVLAAPMWRGHPTTRSYVIVGAERKASRVTDLRGDLHAFLDPESTSGFFLTAADHAEQGLRPGNFFRQTFFTYSDRNVVRAVAAGLAESGTCDAYVYEVLREIEPNLVGATRVLAASEEFGSSPIVIARHGDAHGRGAPLRSLLVGMRHTALGEATLNKLRLDRFVEPPEGLYDRVALAAQALRLPT